MPGASPLCVARTYLGETGADHMAPTLTIERQRQTLLQANADMERERLGLAAQARSILGKPADKRTEAEVAQFDTLEARIVAIEALTADNGTELARIEKVREWERTEAPVVEPDAAYGTLARTNPVGTTNAGPFPTFGHPLQAIAAAARGDVTARDLLLNVNRFRADAQGAGVAIDSDGGFLVQTDLAATILQKMHDVGKVINLVNRWPIGPNSNGLKIPLIDESSRADGSRWGGIRAYWVEEGVAPTKSKPTFDRLNLELHKVAALGYASDELLADAVAMNTMFTNGFAEELLFKVEDAIINGDGAGKPQGILSANATVSITKETNQAATTLLHDNLKKMWARLYARSRATAAWFVNQDVEPALDDLAKDRKSVV